MLLSSMVSRRRRRFDERAERAYYATAPAGHEPMPSESVDAFMTLTTGCRDWPKFLDGKDVLELGAGGCALLRGLLERTRPRRYVASDLFEDRMSAARESLERPFLEFRRLDVLVGDIADGSFDTILSFGLFHHIPEVERAFAECRRMLRPHGTLIFRDPWGGNPVLRLLYRFVFHNSPNERPLLLRRTRTLLESRGFRVNHVGRFWLRFPSLPPGPWSTNVGVCARRE